MKSFHTFAIALFIISGVLALGAVLSTGNHVKAQTASQLAKQVLQPIEDLPFPSGGTYTLKSGTTNLNAAYKFAPQVKGMSADVLSRYGANNDGIDTFLGQARKGIYFAFTNYAAIAGRWDISDPFSPGEPEVIRLSHGVYGGNGPLNDSGFAHDGHYQGAAVAENTDGTARFALGHGMFFNNDQGAAVVNYDGSLAFGQTFNEVDASRFSGNRFGESPLIADESSSGRAFLYAAGSTRYSLADSGNGANIRVWDMTDASGGFNVDDPLKKAGTIGWANVASLAVLKVPGQANHILAAKLGPTNGSGAATGEIRLAEISASTGLPVANKSYKTSSVTLAAASYDLTKGNKELPLGDLQSAIVGGKPYVFVAEKFAPTSFTILPFQGALTIGVYKVNPADLTLSRVGSVVINNTVMGYWKVMDATDGSSPLILAFSVNSRAGKLVTNENPPQILQYSISGKSLTGKYYMDNDFAVYSTAPIFAGGSGANVSQSAFTIPAEGVAFPFKKGDVITPQWPALGFIQPSGTAKYLYFYRNAFTLAGATDQLDYEFPDGQYVFSDQDSINWWKTTHVIIPAFRGYTSLRIDKIDVSAFTGGTSSGNGTGGSGNGGGTGVNVPPLAGGGACYQQFRNLCDQIQTLRQQLCKLVPTISFCSTGFTGGGGGTKTPDLAQ